MSECRLRVLTVSEHKGSLLNGHSLVAVGSQAERPD